MIRNIGAFFASDSKKLIHKVMFGITKPVVEFELPEGAIILNSQYRGINANNEKQLDLWYIFEVKPGDPKVIRKFKLIMTGEMIQDLPVAVYINTVQVPLENPSFPVLVLHIFEIPVPKD